MVIHFVLLKTLNAHNTFSTSFHNTVISREIKFMEGYDKTPFSAILFAYFMENFI